MGGQSANSSECFNRPGSSWSEAEIAAFVTWFFSDRRKQVIRQILRYLGPGATLADAEDVFSSFYDEIGSIILSFDPARGANSFPIFLNFCLSRYCHRRRKRLRLGLYSAMDHELAVSSTRSVEPADFSLRDSLERAINQLAEPKRTAFVLRQIKEEPIINIAQKLGLSEEATKSVVFGARAEVRKALGFKRRRS